MTPSHKWLRTPSGMMIPARDDAQDDESCPIYVRGSDFEEACAEIERLTKERDNLSKLEQSHREQANEQFHRANKAEAERDEARAQVAAAYEVAAVEVDFAPDTGDRTGFKSAIRALTPSDARAARQSMLADAERDMRQRAAELIPPGNLRSEVLALPLKHADREVGK